MRCRFHNRKESLLWLSIITCCCVFLWSCQETKPTTNSTDFDDTKSDWALLNFEKVDSLNPCLLPSPEPIFSCPVSGKTVRWESKDVFNPAVVVRNGLVHMIYRAEDSVGKYNGTSRLGLAVSNDGLTFTKMDKPVLYPDNDLMKRYEWEGGIEDPRIVESPEGKYIMTYTSYDGQIARLCVASSADLSLWTKHGLAFGEAYSGKHMNTWSKSGAIVTRMKGDQFEAAKINGKYWMYWGDKHMYAATSDDLIRWTPVEEKDSLKIVMSYRPGKFDSDLVEPGPQAIMTDRGILLIYNGRNYGPQLDPTIEEGTYSAGQALFDSSDPLTLVDRLEERFFYPDKPYEIFGQVNKVVFLEGLVQFQEKWLLYYGTADSKIAVAQRDYKSF